MDDTSRCHVNAFQMAFKWLEILLDAAVVQLTLINWCILNGSVRGRVSSLR